MEGATGSYSLFRSSGLRDPSGVHLSGVALFSEGVFIDPSSAWLLEPFRPAGGDAVWTYFKRSWDAALDACLEEDFRPKELPMWGVHLFQLSWRNIDDWRAWRKPQDSRNLLILGMGEAPWRKKSLVKCDLRDLVVCSWGGCFEIDYAYLDGKMHFTGWNAKRIDEGVLIVQKQNQRTYEVSVSCKGWGEVEFTQWIGMSSPEFGFRFELEVPFTVDWHGVGVDLRHSPRQWDWFTDEGRRLFYGLEMPDPTESGPPGLPIPNGRPFPYLQVDGDLKRMRKR